jgi:signal transduction histidine kinase
MAREINEAMERVELHAFGLRAMLDTARGELGDHALGQMLSSLGVSPARATARDAWMSMEFVESFMEEMVRRSGDPSIIDRLSRASMTAKYLGPLYPILKAFGNPSVVYEQVVKASPRFNKVGFFRMAQRGKGSVRLEYQPFLNAPRERGELFCRSRQVQLAHVPTLFGLNQARVEHPSCIARGDECCAYELSWRVPLPARQKWIGLGLGLAFSLLVLLAQGAPLPIASCLVAACALAGWAVGRGIELRSTIDERVNDLTEHQAALQQSLEQNEQRLSDLLRSKAEVDAKVVQRTQQLQETSDKLTETLHQVQELDKAKTHFFNNVSHDLRTPLTLILAPVEDLLSGREPTGGSKAALETIQRNAARLLRLINQLLDLAKIDAGKMKLARVPTLVPDFVASVTQPFQTAARQKRVMLETRVPRSMAAIAIDTRWLESALANLLGNALRLVSEDGRVSVSARDLGTDVIFEVQDDGPGMTPGDAERIFERFAQGSDIAAGRGGTGLGLSIVREAARLHGGEASVESELGRGSTFRLKIPRAFEDGQAQRASERPVPFVSAGGQTELVPTPAVAEVHAPRRNPDGHGPAVLVIEDNPDLRAYVADVLSSRYRVMTAENGSQGLRLAAEKPFDLIVTDISMPEMNGFELCRRARADERLKQTPILLLTARSDPSSVLEGFDAGANDYILKPFHSRELLARAEVHLQLHRLIRQTAAQEQRAMLGTLAASVAHQVRNPLTSLISGLPLLRAGLGGPLPERAIGLIDVMIDSSTRIERLTTDLMEVSRIDREQQVEFAPGETLLACVRLISPVASVSGVGVNSHIDTRPRVQGRPADLSHVCLNLFQNALSAAGRGGQIEVLGRNDASGYAIDIGDSGPGIPEAQRQDIFKPFWTNRPAGEGTGLGLAIAQQLVERQGGMLTVGDSSLGGASFRVTLPNG